MSRLLLALLLVCLCAVASAREVRKLAANGGSHCPEVAAAQAAAEDKTPAPRTGAEAPTHRDIPGKPPTVRGNDDSGRLQAPRWHSFLPGMFR